MSNNYFPKLSKIVTVESLPEQLNFIQGGISYLLNGLAYRNLNVVHSSDGSNISYNLDVLSFKRIEYDVFGTGLTLVLNPDSSGMSSFPISVTNYWGIRRYIKNFSLATFPYTPEAFLDLALKITNLTDDRLLYYTGISFCTSEDPFNELATSLANYGLNITLPVSNDIETAINQIIEAAENQNFSLKAAIVAEYIIDLTSIDNSLDNVKQLFGFTGNYDIIAKIEDLFVPQISANLLLSAGLEFPRTMLVPLDENRQPIPITDPDNPPKTILQFATAEFFFSTKGKFGFTTEIAATLIPAVSQIGNTGFTIGFTNVKLDLSRTTNIPEADAAGYPTDFVGVYIESAEIGLPEKWFKALGATEGTTLGIFGKNLLLGTGGVSGTFGIRAIDTNGKPIGTSAPDGAEMKFKLGCENGLTIGFRSFDLTLKQGEFVHTNIVGSLQIPGFKDAVGNDAKIDITMSFDANGDFFITGSEVDGIPIKIPGVMTFLIKTLSVGRKEDKFYISTGGALDFSEQAAIGKLFKDPLDIQLTIWQDGTIELKGLDGAFKLPQPKTLQLGPAEITITAIHFGSDERMHNNIMRKYWYFGFDGGVNINPGGIDARGDGVKVYFTVDNSSSRPLHVFFRIQSLSIDLIIPGSASSSTAAAIISGYLAMKEPTVAGNDGTEYTGGVSLSLPKLKILASAGMRYNPGIPSFLVDVNIDLPMAIPLGPTGVGIYGFRGLLGQRYVASRETAGLSGDSSWYEYYKKKVAPDYREGIQVSKMAQQNGFSVGAGMSVATAFDGGKVFSAKVFVLLSVPDILLIQGQGAILKERVGLDTTNDPPFSAMIAISTKSIESAFGANIKIPDGGEIATLNGTAEMAFFFSNSGAWYVNIGRDQPEDKRIRAKLFTLFNAYFYFMLSKQGINAGAGAKWDFTKRFGPLRFEAGAYLDTTGKVSFKPVQIGGSIALGGYAGVYVWKVGVRIDIGAWLKAEAPKPFIISGGLSFQIRVPWPFKKLGGPYTVDFTWSFNKERDLNPISLIDPYNGARAINRLTGETYPLLYSATGAEAGNMNPYIVSVDSFIDIEFLKGMGLQYSAGLSKFGVQGQGAYNTELVPPRKGKSAQVQHKFQLEDISIEYKNGSTWTTYDIYQGIRPAATDETEIDFPANTDHLKCGYWQDDTPNKYNKLRIFAQSPLSYITRFTSGLPTLPEDLGYKEGFFFCEGQQKPKTCVIFPTVGQVFKTDVCTERQRILIRVTGRDGRVISLTNSFGLQNALNFGGKVELFFAEEQAEVVLRLSSYAEQVRIKYFRKVQVSNAGFANLPVFEDIEIAEKIIDIAKEGNWHTVSYKQSDYNNAAVDWIEIESIGGAVDTGYLLTERPEYLLQENRGKLLLENAFAYHGETQLFSICTLNVIDNDYNWSVKTQREVDETVYAMRENFTTNIDPIWRPDTVFRIKVTTNDVLVNEKNYRNDYYFLFKTAGPLGHFHQYSEVYKSLLKQDREDQFKLATLKPYIDYSRSYPNADGRLTNAKPLFYHNPKLLMFYTENSIYAMYNSFSAYGNKGELLSKLSVLIKDPTETISTDPENPTPSLIGTNSWKKNPNPIMTPEVRMINNLSKDGDNCAGFGRFTPLAVMQEINIGELRPDTLYTAVFNAVYQNANNQVQVHSYVFKTSQYADFKAQVQSCILRDEKGVEVRKAVFILEKEIDVSSLSKAVTLLDGTMSATDPLVNEYATEFNRMTDGILQIGVLPPALTTDFTVVKDSHTGNSIGIIVRNLEPFNDPKIPQTDLSDMLQMSVNGSSVSDFKVILSADKSQAFISNTVLNIPSGTAVFTFRYKRYDMTAKGYVTLTTEVVEVEI